MKKLLWFVAIYLLMGSVFADGTVCQMQPGGVLDTFQSDFFNQAQSFATKALPTVTNIYWLLFALWAAWEMSFNQVLGMNIQRLYVWWVARIFIAYTIEHIFLDPTFYVGIIKFGAQLGSTMGGFTVNPDSASPLGVFTPSAIMGINDCVAVAVQNAGVNPFNILGSMELFAIQFGFLIVSGLTAFYVLYLSIKIWIALFAGFVNAMFAGNEWTVTWWQQYLSTVIRYAIELMIVAAMFGVINGQLSTLVNTLSAAGGKLVDNYGTYIKSMAEVAFMVFLLFTLPKEISSSMGGSFGGKLTDLAGKLATKASGYVTGGFGMGGGGLTPGGNQIISATPGGGNSSGNASEIFGNGSGNTTASNPNDWKDSSGGLSASEQSSPQVSGQQWQDAASKIDV